MNRIYEKSKRQACGRPDNRGFLTPANEVRSDNRGFLTPAGAGAKKIMKIKGPAAPSFNLPWVVMAFLFILAVTVLAPTTLTAQDGKGQDPQAMVIETPHGYIEKNLNAFKERLMALKALYEGQYGSPFAGVSPTDVATIAKDLPKPSTLRLAITLPPAKEAEATKQIKEKGEYFVDNIEVNAVIDPLFGLTGGYYAGYDDKAGLVSTDLNTTQMLGIPQKVQISMNAFIFWVSKKMGSSFFWAEEIGTSFSWEGEKMESSLQCCAMTAIYSDSREYCTAYKRLPSFGWTRGDPRYYAGELGLKASGAVIGEGMKDVTFTRPGIQNISFVSERKYSSDENYELYTDCIPNYSYSKRTVIGYRPAGRTAADFFFKAVTFKKFGFPGHEIDASYGRMPVLDLFYEQKALRDGYVYGGASAGELLPLILIDYGDAGGLKAVRPADIKAPVTWSTISPGSFVVDEGRVSYRGGTETTTFKVTLGGYESVEKSITANMIEVVLDAAMERGKISPGKAYKALIRVKGPADLTGYQVKWTAEGGSWTEPAASFKKAGEAWEAEGTFTIPFGGSFDPAQLGKPVKIVGDLTRTADNNKVYSFNKALATSYPAIDKLELYVGVNGRDPAPATAPVDIFLSTEVTRVMLAPRLFFPDGKPYAMNMASPQANIEVTSSNPGALSVREETVQLRTGKTLYDLKTLAAYPGEMLGTAKVTARMGGRDIDSAEHAQFTGNRKELTSAPVEINVNTVFLIGEPGSGGKTTIYKLMVTGPADMSPYLTRWTGEAPYIGAFKKDAGGLFVSAVETGLRMDKVAIERAGAVVAEVSVKTMVRNMSIRLLPPVPPVTIVTKAAVGDVGSIETITACKKSVTSQMALTGFNPGMSAADYCQAQRTKNKEALLSERADQKAFNQMVLELDRQGQNLVIMDDAMQVGAAIGGDLTATGDTPFCFWTLENGGALTLDKVITPVELITQKEGGCFNRVQGLKGGFNPDAVIKVDLVFLARPEVPIVAPGGPVVTNGFFLYR